MGEGAAGRGLIGCADERWLRESGGHPSVTAEIREAIHAVRRETLHRSKVSMRTGGHDQAVRSGEFGPRSGSPATGAAAGLAGVVRDRAGQRQRYARSAELPTEDTSLVDRPGQVVALDTTVLPVKVREEVFGEPVSVHLTLALDVYSHSSVAFRLTLVADTSVDIAMVLRDVMMPLPMRPDWDEEMEWPYPGLPAAVVAEFAGHQVAGLPFFAPETVTTDHGSSYRNHHLVREPAGVLGCNILPGPCPAAHG